MSNNSYFIIGGKKNTGGRSKTARNYENSILVPSYYTSNQVWKVLYLRLQSIYFKSITSVSFSSVTTRLIGELKGAVKRNLKYWVLLMDTPHSLPPCYRSVFQRSKNYWRTYNTKPFHSVLMAFKIIDWVHQNGVFTALQYIFKGNRKIF